MIGYQYKQIQMFAKIVYISFLCALLRAQEPPPDPPEPDPPIITPNCTAFDPLETQYCVISDLNFTISGANQTLDISYNGTIKIINTFIYCNDTCTLQNGTETERSQVPQECCQVKINATNDVYIDQVLPSQSNITFSYFKVNNIDIRAGGTIKLGGQSGLSVAGMGNMYGLGFETNATGGSFAAQSGFTTTGQKSNFTSIYGRYFQTPDNCPIEWQYGSGGGNNLSVGGGRISLIARSFSLYGNIYAGGTPTAYSINNAAGSGGYIYLKQIIDQVPQDQNPTFGQVLIQGKIQADGGKGINSGGSGGRIVLDFYPLAFNSTMVDTKAKQFSALGGQTSSLSVFGGLFQQIGGPGTIYYKSESKLYIRGPDYDTQPSSISPATLIHDLDDREDQQYQPLNTLHINVQAIVGFQAPSGLSYNDTKAVLSNLTMERYAIIISIPDQINRTLTVQSDVISMRDNSQVITRSTNLTFLNVTKQFTVQSNSKLDTGQYLDIKCDQLYLYGQVIVTAKNPNALESGQLHIKQASIRDLKQSVYNQPLSFLTIITKTLMNITNDPTQPGFQQIQADRIFFYSLQDINITSYISSQLQQGTQTCSYNLEAEVFSFVQSKQQIPLNQSTMLSNYAQQFNIDTSQMEQDIRLFRDKLASNFTYTIIAMNRLKLIDPATIIETSRIGIYAKQLEIEGTIDTSGQGCVGSDGLGRGRAPAGNCSASGASFGGRGGRATAINTNDTLNIKKCHQFQPEPYSQFDSFQAFEGSGGGLTSFDPADQDSSAGGGYIWLQSSNLTFINRAKLLANGYGPKSDTRNGGGSGGSIVLSTNQLFGSALIEANGGSTQQGLGGGGSGGRLKFYYFSWFDSKFYTNPDSLNITVQALGGLSSGKDISLIGDTGSIWSPPCAPGYYGFFCQPCPVNTFKAEYSNVGCRLCRNMPPEAKNNANYTKVAQKLPKCEYQCRQDFTPFNENPKCLSNVQLFFDNIGGVSIFVILVLTTIFAIIVIVYTLYQRNKKNDENFENDENLNKLRLAFEELDFIQRDLYQHVCRVYLLGNNEIDSPWIIPMTPPNIIIDRINLEKYQNFARQINGCYTHTKMELFLSKSLPFLYPVLKPLLNKLKRQERYYNFKQALISIQDKMDFWKSVDDQLNIEVRFTASEDFTQGFMDILDTKRTRDSFQKPSLPMTIVVGGTGSFAKPFQITRHDPLIKAIIYCIDDPSNLMWDMFLANLNSQLHALCIQNFGFLVRWRLLQVLSFINEYSKKLFERKGLKLSLYLIEASNYTSDAYKRPGSQSPAFMEEQYYILNYDFLRRKRDLLNRFILYWRTEALYNHSKFLKLALVITPLNQQVLSQTPRTSRQISSNIGGQLKSTENQMSPSKMISKASQSIMFKNRLSADTGNYTKILASTPYSSTNDVNYIQLLIGTVKLDRLDYNKVKIFRDLKYGKVEKNEDLNNNHEGEISGGRISLRDSLVGNADATTCEIFTYYLKQTLMQIAALIKSISLRHSLVIKNFIVAAIFYIIFVVMDLTFSLTLTIQAFQSSQNSHVQLPMLIFFLFYPLAIVISPLLSILSIMMCKAFLYRASAYMNALCLYSNFLGLIISELIIVHKIETQRLVYIIILIVTKLALSQLLSVQIAYFKNSQYFMYEAKLDELVIQAENEDMDIRARAIQLDLILEQTNENYGTTNTVRRGGVGDQDGDVTPPNSIPEMGGLMYGGNNHTIYSPKGQSQQYQDPQKINHQSFGNSEDEFVYQKNYQ